MVIVCVFFIYNTLKSILPFISVFVYFVMNISRCHKIFFNYTNHIDKKKDHYHNKIFLHSLVLPYCFFILLASCFLLPASCLFYGNLVCIMISLFLPFVAFTMKLFIPPKVNTACVSVIVGVSFSNIFFPSLFKTIKLT